MLQSELEHFLQEDLGEDIYPEITGSTTTDAIVVTNESGIIAGIDEASQVFNHFEIEVVSCVDDGTSVGAGTEILEVSGPANGILKAERLALNFIGRMSGIASLTHQCKRLAGDVIVAGTRKTTPGFRKFEKKAIILGGGDPHRYNLSDTVMVKDNHIKLIGIRQAVINAKKAAGFTRKIEVEVENVSDAVRGAELGAEIIMLDNCKPQEIKEIIQVLKERSLREKIILEASGGINPSNIEKYAEAGIDVISIGSLTHNAPWLDVSLTILQR